MFFRWRGFSTDSLPYFVARFGLFLFSVFQKAGFCLSFLYYTLLTPIIAEAAAVAAVRLVGCPVAVLKNCTLFKLI